MGSRCTGFRSLAHGLSCSLICGIFLDQRLISCPLHWQADSQPLDHQGSLYAGLLRVLIQSVILLSPKLVQLYSHWQVWDSHFPIPSPAPGIQFSSVQSLSRVRLFATPWTAARQASLSITSSWSLLHRVGDAIQPSHPLSFPSPALNLSQHQGLFNTIRYYHFLNLCQLHIKWWEGQGIYRKSKYLPLSFAVNLQLL